MKGKFKLLGHIGLVLFMVSALMLAVAPVAQAATSVTDVWVEFPSTDAAGSLDSGLEFNKSSTLLLMRIHFKATTALVRSVDTITIQFPDGVDSNLGYAGGSDYDFALGSGCSTAGNFDIDADASGTAYTYYDCTSAAYGGYRITVTIGVDIAAGSEVWLMIDDAASTVTSGAEYSLPYKVKVHTSKDTTPVLSKGFYIGDDQVSTTDVEVSPATAGAENAQYTITFTPGETLAANTDTITVTFPYGITLPSSITASAVSVYDGADWYTCGVAPTIDTDLRTVTATT
ncbi:MAG: hypothetical protein OEZ07_02950, partial [Dehalococcoidia bacterium]|nr:hypothetical protein [Dehalococcoidia bacterium]